MTFTRYSAVERGALSFTGNTLGLIGTFYPSLSRITFQADGIGTFITNDTLLQSPGGYPIGTTQDFTLNESTAYLSMLPDSEVLYAELTWGGSFINALQDQSATIDDSVKFTTSTGSYDIFPDVVTSESVPITGTAIHVYKRSADVTTIVQGAGATFYTVGNVTGALGPTYAPPATNFIESNFLGWNLSVAYKNQSLPYRNLTLWSLLEAIGINPVVDVTIADFSTPTQGDIEGRLLISAGSGDSFIGGDTFRFGPSAGSLTQLSGLNNPINNFFCSQINQGDSENGSVGLLNTTGTFGSNNQPTNAKSLNGRQGFDITNIDVSQTLTYNQTEATIRMDTAGDYYYPLALGLQLDVNSANLSPIVKSRDKEYADVGDIIEYTVTFGNQGLVDAEGVTFIDTITDSTSFIIDSLYVDGVQRVGENPYYPGISLDTIPPSKVTTITFSVMVDSIPIQNPIQNNVGIGYSFISAPSLPRYFAFDSSNTVETEVNNANLNVSKIRDKDYAEVGDIITYRLFVVNDGNTITNSILFKDTLPEGTIYVIDSLIVDSVTIAGDIESGVTIPNIDVSSGITIEFQVEVTTIPVVNPIVNEGKIIYDYVVDPSIPVINQKEILSNNVYTMINSIDLTSISKSVDKAFTTCGETITYTIEIPNRGNIDGKDLIFYDTLDNSLVFIEDSVFLDNVQQPSVSPLTGITVGTILAGQVRTIQFQAQVIC